MSTKLRDGEEKLVGVIADEDTVMGLLLAGCGDNSKKAEGPNFHVVGKNATIEEMEEAFNKMTARKDIVILLITQSVANDIRHLIVDYEQTIPAVLEIPSKDIPYDTNNDTILVKVNRVLGSSQDQQSNYQKEANLTC